MLPLTKKYVNINVNNSDDFLVMTYFPWNSVFQYCPESSMGLQWLLITGFMETKPEEIN